jgi:hypothetical protein
MKPTPQPLDLTTWPSRADKWRDRGGEPARAAVEPYPFVSHRSCAEWK